MTDYSEKLATRVLHQFWQHILGCQYQGKVLCLDTQHGVTTATLMHEGSDVTLVHPDATELRRIKAAIEKNSGTAPPCVEIDSKFFRLPFPDQSFDGFILHDTGNSLLTRQTDGLGTAGLFALIEEASRVLKSDGFFYIGMQNRYSYANLKALLMRRQPVTDWLAPSIAKKAMIANGFSNLNCFPLLITGDKTYEILSLDGYRSVKTRVLQRERIKETVIGRTGSKWLAHGYGITGFRNSHGKLLVEELIQTLVNHNLLQGATVSAYSFRRIFILASKAIVSVGTANSRQGEVIVIMTQTAQSAKRRTHEKTLLEQVTAMLPPRLAGKLPVLLGQFEFHQHACMVYSEIPGMSIDQDFDGLQQATNNALRFLIDIQHSTLQSRAFDTTLFKHTIDPLFDSAIKRNAWASEHFDRLRSAVESVLSGGRIETVLMHGDYKIENVIINEQSLQVEGVIDWDIAVIEGLPMLDLWYMITFNRLLRGTAGFMEIFENVILPGNFSPEERQMVERYAAEIQLSAEMRRVLPALYLVQHFGPRVSLHPHHIEARQSLIRHLQGLTRTLSH